MRRKPVHVFLLHAAFLLALFTVLPGSRELYPRIFQAQGNALFASLGGGRSVRFEWIEPSKRADAADTRMLGLEAGRAGYHWRSVFSIHWRGFWPTASFAALVLAMPMSRRRRAWALPAGILLIDAFLLLQVGGLSALWFAASPAAPEGSREKWQALMPLAGALFNSPIANFTIVLLLFVWLANPTRGLDLESLNALLRPLWEADAAGPSEPAAPMPPSGGAAPRSEGAARERASPDEPGR